MASPKFFAQAQSTKMLEKMIARVAKSEANILILGEVGTGKSLIASLIHEGSSRKYKPFIKVDCSTLRETLLESEIFGHEKGAFNGAYSKKIGLIEVAHGGTLFLEKIETLSPGLQAKLYHFLSDAEFYRLGGKVSLKSDIRLICASKEDLDKQVLSGTFREDLFYRLNTVMMRVPSLRQRLEDLPQLIAQFSKEQGEEKTFSPEALEKLAHYDWPGNVKELKNLIECLWVEVDNEEILASDLPQNIQNPDALNMDAYDPNLTLYEIEKLHILKALTHFRGNKTQAANALGITIKTLYNKLHEFNAFEQFEDQKAKKPNIDEDSNPTLAVYESERRHLQRTMKRYLGDKTQVAKALGISVERLNRRIALLNLTEEFTSHRYKGF